ncbi:MAG: CBS domain-containing protein [Lysobacteraceae bacterium]
MLRINVPVDEFTTPDPVTASEEMTVQMLRNLMDAHGIRHLPVLRDGAVVGLVSDRDVRLATGLDDFARGELRAADIMAADPLSVTAGAPLDEVAFLMSEKKVGSVIVNDAEGGFVGIFTATDALNALIEIIRSGGAPAA